MSYTSPLEEHKFKRLVKEYNCTVVQTKKHYLIVNARGVKISRFAVTHSKKGKREVLPIYINQFLDKIKETGD